MSISVFPDFFLTEQHVLDRFADSIKENGDDLDAWNKLPMTAEEKYTFLMESSTDPIVRELYKKIKVMRAKVAEDEAKSKIPVAPPLPAVVRGC